MREKARTWIGIGLMIIGLALFVGFYWRFVLAVGIGLLGAFLVGTSNRGQS